ncbi:site-specific DNA-methyltransferase [Methylobacterium oxalidis]|uniref:site-specific DNA-methyltransferase n=1 Tax=Methylobacterium oxalidis TaxID=944322 RepID=UPI003314B98D
MAAKKATKPAQAWPADHVERRAVAALEPYARNARTHSAEQVEQIVASIREWGWTNPVLVDEEGTIVAGHGRVLAAVKLGYPDVPVMVARGWTEAQRRAYVIADNQLAANAGWDEDLLRVEFADLQALDFDLGLTGFSIEAIAGVLAQPISGLTDPDEAPRAPADPITQAGDLWILGRHRIICGSSTSAADVEKVLAGAKPHLMVTDPPYGVEYDPGWRRETGLASKGIAEGKVLNDDRADWREAWALFPGAVAYVWHGGLHTGTVMESLTACRFAIRAQIIWVKPRFAISRGHYHWQHEPCLYGVREGEEDEWRFVPEHEVAAYAVKDGKAAEWRGGRKQSTIWNIEHVRCDTGHGTQKPVECMRRPIENNSAPGQAIYEPFSGSGTTIIAAEMTGRACHAVELNPAYVDVAVQRWEAFTGLEAQLEETGETFAEVRARSGSVERARVA